MKPWADVDEAIRQAIMGDPGLRAVDPERLSARVSWERPNPRRTPTVRRTGHEGSPERRDPLDAVARGRMRALIHELPELMRAATVGVAFGVRRSVLAEELRSRGMRFRNGTLDDLAAQGRAMLASRMCQAGLTGGSRGE